MSRGPLSPQLPTGEWRSLPRDPDTRSIEDSVVFDWTSLQRGAYMSQRRGTKLRMRLRPNGSGLGALARGSTAIGAVS